MALMKMVNVFLSYFIIISPLKYLYRKEFDGPSVIFDKVFKLKNLQIVS